MFCYSALIQILRSRMKARESRSSVNISQQTLFTINYLFRHLLTGKTTEKLDASLDALITPNLVYNL